MDFLMALLADYQGFASACGHSLNPWWLFFLPWLIQISELADVMNFAVILRSTEFALIGQKSLHYLAPQAVVDFQRAIINYGVFLSPQFNASKSCHQRLLLLAALHYDLQRFEPPVGSRNRRLILSGHLTDTDSMFIGQRLG
jgi:hypothetical protein